MNAPVACRCLQSNSNASDEFCLTVIPQRNDGRYVHAVTTDLPVWSFISPNPRFPITANCMSLPAVEPIRRCSWNAAEGLNLVGATYVISSPTRIAAVASPVSPRPK